MINFEDEFWNLTHKIEDTLIIFYKNGEPGWTINTSTKYVIAINQRLSWRNKFFVLCHEVGHLFSVDKDDTLVISYTDDETLAHQRARILMKDLDEDCFEEYVEFFNKKRGIR